MLFCRRFKMSSFIKTAIRRFLCQINCVWNVFLLLTESTIVLNIYLCLTSSCDVSYSFAVCISLNSKLDFFYLVRPVPGSNISKSLRPATMKECSLLQLRSAKSFKVIRTLCARYVFNRVPSGFLNSAQKFLLTKKREWRQRKTDVSSNNNLFHPLTAFPETFLASVANADLWKLTAAW